MGIERVISRDKGEMMRLGRLREYMRGMGRYAHSDAQAVFDVKDGLIALVRVSWRSS